MTSKTRLTVLLVSTPIIVLVLLGGFLNRVLADQDSSYQHLRVFEEVVSLVMSNYVEPVKNERIMRGALQGLAEGLDADSAWLTPAQVAVVSKAQAPAKGTRRTGAHAAVLPAGHRGARRVACGKSRPGHRRLHPRDQRRADARAVGVGRRSGASRRAGIEGDPHGAPRQRGRAA